jgi:DtxR family Mn-dependent transcriptional regulator
MKFSYHIEDYLKNIHFLQSQHTFVPTNVLANRLGVSAPSVSGMVRKLANLGLLEHERYKGARLTSDGRTIARQVIRAHRLWELYLVQALELSWDQAHVEAEQLEHVLSDELAGRLDDVLGHPTIDPHGHPIPDRSGEMVTVVGRPLTQLAVGESGVTVQIWDDTPELLRYLGGLDIYPGCTITVLEIAPFNGPLHLRVGEESQVLGRDAAKHVIVATDNGGQP